MPAYWIAHVTVTDAEAYGRYAKLAAAAIEASTAAASSPAAAGTCSSRAHDRARNVLIEFPSLEAAEACYRSAGLPGRADPCPRSPSASWSSSRV